MSLILYQKFHVTLVEKPCFKPDEICLLIIPCHPSSFHSQGFSSFLFFDTSIFMTLGLSIFRLFFLRSFVMFKNIKCLVHAKSVKQNVKDANFLSVHVYLYNCIYRIHTVENGRCLNSMFIWIVQDQK